MHVHVHNMHIMMHLVLAVSFHKQSLLTAACGIFKFNKQPHQVGIFDWTQPWISYCVGYFEHPGRQTS